MNWTSGVATVPVGPEVIVTAGDWLSSNAPESHAAPFGRARPRASGAVQVPVLRSTAGLVASIGRMSSSPPALRRASSSLGFKPPPAVDAVLVVLDVAAAVGRLGRTAVDDPFAGDGVAGDQVADRRCAARTETAFRRRRGRRRRCQPPSRS